MFLITHKVLPPKDLKLNHLMLIKVVVLSPLKQLNQAYEKNIRWRTYFLLP